MKTRCLVRKRSTVAAVLAGWFFMAGNVPARAGLGGDSASVAADAVMMGATTTQPSADASVQSVASPATYQVQSFVTARGVTVREYVASSGAVFGVAWQGHRPPDLSILLGSYYPQYVAASRLGRHKDLHRARFAGLDAVVIMAGHIGHLTGRAFVAGLAPFGLDPNAVVK
jgi:hypothetical protein